MRFAEAFMDPTCFSRAARRGGCGKAGGDMRLRLALAVMLLGLALPHRALAWGASGHSIVAEIAQRHLEPAVLAKVKGLLGGEISLASIASWADDVRPHETATTNWHFVDIPYDAARFDPARDCQESDKGDCVINAIARLRKTLADASQSKEGRLRALKFLVHFLGDIHQPLHCAERSHDRGGNDVMVFFFGTRVALHAVWDTEIIQKRVFNWGDYVRYLEEEWLPRENASALAQGEPVSWALESHAAAVQMVYALPGTSISMTTTTRRPYPSWTASWLPRV
jgi:S1/P1 Nuclease